MQPYINPNYFNNYAPMPPQMPPSTRFVTNFNEISVNDVPMDGKYALFAKSDMSEIQARAWTPQGMITTLEYSLKQPSYPSTDSIKSEPTNLEEEIKGIKDNISLIIQKLDSMGKAGKKNESTANA